MNILFTAFVTAVAVLCIQNASCLETRDLASDAEAAHGQLLIHSARSSQCFFRTNDIKTLINGNISQDVDSIANAFAAINVEPVVISKFRADMAETATSANNLLQLEMNTFKGYEERLHTYAENLLVNLALIPENLDQLIKDTKTTDSIYQAVDNNMNIYKNFLTAEVVAIVGDNQDPIVLDIFSMLENSVLIFDAARLALSDVKTEFDLQAVTAEAYLAIVASQV